MPHDEQHARKGEDRERRQHHPHISSQEAGENHENRAQHLGAHDHPEGEFHILLDDGQDLDRGGHDHQRRERPNPPYEVRHDRLPEVVGDEGPRQDQNDSEGHPDHAEEGQRLGHERRAVRGATRKEVEEALGEAELEDRHAGREDEEGLAIDAVALLAHDANQDDRNAEGEEEGERAAENDDPGLP